MKILQVGKYYHPDHGGIETVIQNLSEGLVEHGHEVKVLCSSGPALNFKTQLNESSMNGVHIYRVPSYGVLLSQPLSMGLPFAFTKLAQDFDIIHVHTPNPLAEISSALISNQKPLVVSYHSDIVRQKMVLPLYQPLLKRFLNQAKRIVVATQNHVRYSPHLSLFQEKCTVVPYGISGTPFRTSSEKNQKADQLRNLGKYVLFVGRLVSYKGVEILIDALAQVDIHAVIVGEGPLKESLILRAKKLNILNRVHFVGSVPDSQELAAYYKASEFLILPSITKNEAFGMVQLEAMASGRPVIASRLNSGVSLVQEEGITGLYFNPSDPQDLARAMKELLSDPKKLTEMGIAAQKRFENHYTQKKMVEGYLKVYEALF